MLSWRLKIGIPMVMGLLLLAFLDMYLSDQLVSFWILKRIPRGIILFPLFLVVIVMLCDEVLDLLAVRAARRFISVISGLSRFAGERVFGSSINSIKSKTRHN